MKNKKILKHYSAKKIEEAIKICDNLFYGKYLETGELKTREELQQHIKNEVTEAFVKFWGDDYVAQLAKRIASTNIHFVYQIDGPSNSLDGYLVDLKTKRFNERYNTQYESPVFFKHVANYLSKSFDPVKKLQKTLELNEVPYNLTTCLEDLKINTNKILEDKEFAKSVVEQIKILGNQFNQVTYNDNREVNKNLNKLEKLVYKVEKHLSKACKRNDISVYDALFKSDFGIDFDPLVAVMNLDQKAKIMLRQPDFAGLRSENSSDVYFSINPGDDTLLHEFVHEVDDVGFEKDHKNWTTSIYSDQLRQNQMFNEVITDYFALLMKKQRLADGKTCIVSDNDEESEYSYLFEKMGKFLDAYLPELKVVRLREYPAEEFARIIGQKNFQMIAMLSNELIALKHDLKACQIAQESDLTLGDLTADSGLSFYGSLEYFANEMSHLEKYCDKKMDNYMQSALRKQSLAKKIDLFLSDKSLDIAVSLAKNKNPKLRKLAEGFTQASHVFKGKAEKQALKNLKEPLQDIGLKKPLLLEDKTTENDNVTEM